MMSRWEWMGCVALCLLALTACNTIEGMGEDIETGGDIVQDTAGDTQEKMPRRDEPTER